MDEEILTGLRNAIEHGESLQEAMQVMVNSGYGAREVQEASKFIGDFWICYSFTKSV